MQVLHIISSLAARSGGPVEALAGWCDGLIASGAGVSIGALDIRCRGPRAAFDPRAKMVLADCQIAAIAYGHDLARLLRREEFDLIHSHGLWQYPNYLAPSLADARRVPHIISPCGMLDSKALARSALRKRVAAAIFQRRALTEAATLIAN